jgi:hypothetical protein
MIYTALCIMFWMRAYPLLGQVGGGCALVINYRCINRYLCVAATAGSGEEWELELLEPGDLPAWATQSHTQRVEWVNTLIAQGSPT